MERDESFSSPALSLGRFTTLDLLRDVRVSERWPTRIVRRHGAKVTGDIVQPPIAPSAVAGNTMRISRARLYRDPILLVHGFWPGAGLIFPTVVGVLY